MIFKARIHPLAIIVPTLLCCCGIGFLMGKHKDIIDYFTAELAVTDRRLIGKHGLLSIEPMELVLEKISAIQVKQGIIGRLLNYGTLKIATDGYHRHVFHNISDPFKFKKIFNDTLESRKKTGIAA